jgi:hypothetical protein
MTLKKLLFGIAVLLFSNNAIFAEIVYNPSADLFFGSNQKLDFNNDSVIDIAINSSFLMTNAIPPSTFDSYYFSAKNYLGAGPSGPLYETYSGRFLSQTSQNNVLYAPSFAPGTLIGPNSLNEATWSETGADVNVLSIIQLSGNSTTQTPIILGKEYLGFQFLIGTETHFGWILIDRAIYSEVPENGLGLLVQTGPRLLSWAYETNPNTPINIAAVPEPASCGAAIFASFIGALVIRRKRNRNRN